VNDGVLLAIGALAAFGFMALKSAVSAFLAGAAGKQAPGHRNKAAEQHAANQRAEANIEARIVHVAVGEAVKSKSPEVSIASLWNNKNKES